MTCAHLCPRCEGHGLDIGRVHGITVEVCGACAGVWLPDAVARRVLDLFNPEGEDLLPRPSQRLCPACRGEFSEWRVPGTRVRVDSCEGHGTWFDRDELAILTVAAAARRERCPFSGRQ